jgi:Fuc2NAc and GlcNAc transferase
VIALAVTLVTSALLCGLYLPLSRRLQLVDRPNERSSHSLPTPHGGGVAILLALAAGLFLSGPWSSEYLVIAGLGMLMMVVGVLDDLRSLSVRLRIAVYALCSLLLAWLLLPSAQLFILFAVALATVWMVNLYNFMDGIDGIAATQCILACFGAALLAWLGGAPGGQDYALFCLLLVAAQVGFLVWNWPPARLFMGDAGSVPTGLLLSGLTLHGWAQGVLDPACWIILLAIFVTDASWTVLWRFFSGQPVTQAHSLHAYQRLSRHWGSHLAVDLLLMVINALWLFPLAWAASMLPAYAWIFVILAYLPLLVGMVRVRKFA